MFKYTILFFILFSCSANYHLNKAIKKGAKLKTIEVVKHDTTYFSDHYYQVDTVFNNEVLVEYVPQTKWKVRFDNKRFNDSLKWAQRAFRTRLTNFRKVYRDSIQVEKKKLSNERNKNNRLNRFLNSAMVFFIVLLIIYILGKTLVERLLK